MAKKKTFKIKGNKQLKIFLLLLGIVLALELILFLVPRVFDSKEQVAPRSTPLMPVLEKQNLQEKSPIKIPQGWETYSINNVASISVPKEWFFFVHSRNSETGDENYTISNLKQLDSRQDWNPGEEFRVVIGSHQSTNFEQRVKDKINQQYRLNKYEYPGTVDPYSLDTFLLNGNRIARFREYGGTSYTPSYLQVVELGDGKLLEINIGMSEEGSEYMNQFNTLLDSLVLKN